MLLLKRVKYRRVHRGRMKGKATRGNTVTYGEFGLQATEPAWITSNPVSYTHLDVYKRQGQGRRLGGVVNGDHGNHADPLDGCEHFVHSRTPPLTLANVA